jgi:hypothetical protein
MNTTEIQTPHGIATVPTSFANTHHGTTGNMMICKAYDDEGHFNRWAVWRAPGLGNTERFDEFHISYADERVADDEDVNGLIDVEHNFRLHVFSAIAVFQRLRGVF